MKLYELLLTTGGRGEEQYFLSAQSGEHALAKIKAMFGGELNSLKVMRITELANINFLG